MKRHGAILLEIKKKLVNDRRGCQEDPYRCAGLEGAGGSRLGVGALEQIHVSIAMSGVIMMKLLAFWAKEQPTKESQFYVNCQSTFLI